MSNPTPIPPDDEARQLTVANPEDERLPHIAVVGDTYTILVRGEDTAGRYALINMLIPAGGGPPLHRHDFEEMFHIVEGEIDVTIRGVTSKAVNGETVNVPALAPHRFHNPTDRTVRLLCLVAPAGLEAYFAEFGDPLLTRTSPAPALTEDEISERMRKAKALAPKYRIEIL
jgi:quercetin dioxygenase-like cupin family protein